MVPSRQTTLTLDAPVQAKEGEERKIRFAVRKSRPEGRELDVKLSYAAVSKKAEISRTEFFRLA